MAEPGALINIGELAKPATALVEKVSAAVGVVFEPYQMRRIARASADVAVIEAESALEVADIHRRAMIRFVQEETKKQENIEAITARAIPHLDETSNADQIENDWISNFFDKGRLISDAEMQDLWAKILAGEANAPGTYSKRTVSVLDSLDKKDAVTFTSLCTCCWMVGNITPVIYDVQVAVLAELGLNFTSLTHLEAIGLIRFEGLGGYQRVKLPKRVGVVYYGTAVILEFSKDEGNTLDVGHVMLTQAGQQLAPICDAKPSQEVYRHTIDHWTKNGLKVASPWPRQNLQP